MHRLLLLISLLAGLWIPVNSTFRTAVVQTNYGPVQGQEVVLFGPRHKVFKGIPYAAPPVGDLRFVAPKPPEKWTEVKDAANFGYICPQKKHLWLPPMSEDCLTLNVYTPSIEKDSSAPVLVWIHGGAFYLGDGTDSLYGPQYLVAEDLVVVTINYRLGPLGFLTANTADASGNWGLKDQVAALQWVQENIAYFGGDPKQVTIYGESAGAISVHLHMLSPLSDGLFSKAIAASGAATMRSVVRSSDHDVKHSENLARLLGAEASDMESPEKMIEFLRKVDADKLIEHAPEAAESENFMAKPIPFVPVIEPSGSEDAFLTEEPRKLLAEGKFAKVPMIMGVNDLEGAIMFVGLGQEITPKSMSETEENVCLVLPDDLKEAVMERGGCQDVAQEIRNTYFDGQPFNSSLLNFVNMCGDLSLTLPVHLAQRIHARRSTEDPPIYTYYFTFDGRWSIVKKVFQINLPGAAHSDDLSYVFKPAFFIYFPMDPTPEGVTRSRMVRLLADFVKTGDPTPTVSDLIPIKWEPATEEEPTTLAIGSDLKMENEFLKARMGLWDKVYKEYTGNSLFG